MSDNLLVNRLVREKEQETVKRTQVTAQKCLASNLHLPLNNHSFDNPPISATTTTYTVDYGPKTVDEPAITPLEPPKIGNNSHLEFNGADNAHDTSLVSRKKTEHTTQKITTTTKVIRELRHIGPNGEVIQEFIECPVETSANFASSGPIGPSLSSSGYIISTGPESVHAGPIDTISPIGPNFLNSGRGQIPYHSLANSRYEMDPYNRPRSPNSSKGHFDAYTGSGAPPQGYDYDPYTRRTSPPQDEFFASFPPGSQTYPSQFRDPEGEVDYPPTGYGEVDPALIATNGSDTFRNSPSAAVHGVPNDGYDPSFETENLIPDYGRSRDQTGLVGSMVRDLEENPYGRRVLGPEDHIDRGYTARELEQYSFQESETLTYGGLKPRVPLNYGDIPPRGSPQTSLRMRGSPQTSLRMRGSPQASLRSNQYDPEKKSSIRGTPLPYPSPQIPSENHYLNAPPPLPPHPPSRQTPSHNDIYVPPSILRSSSADSSIRVRWRDPDLHEVVDFLSNNNDVVVANAAAYLQHLCYMDDAIKQKARILGAIPPLVGLLSRELPDLHRNACGALRNLSYGRQNDDNKKSIKESGGIPSLVRLLKKTRDNDVKELVTGVLWNLSSSEELKQTILDEALGALVSHVIIPSSGWDGGEVERDPNNDVWWSTVFKNASGIIRNISSAGEYARSKLRHCPGLVDALFCVIKLAIQGNSHDNKSIENCVCILRNLSYRCQEVEDPHYDKHQFSTSLSRSNATGSKADNSGCFGGSRRKKELVGGHLKDVMTDYRTATIRGQPIRGMELLWQPELVVQPYLSLLSDCSNPETLEASAGALQNLAACYWQPSIDVRAAVRKEKGLPILVELLRMEVDKVVCAVATALRNLAIDQRNKELIGKYAMKDLVQKLPSPNIHDDTTGEDTIAAVLATLNEVIKKNAEFSRSLLDTGGVDRLVYITRMRNRYASRVVKFASQVLFSMWAHQELREVYKKVGWKEQDFVSKSVAARSAAGGTHSPNANNTLNRPMASQGGTRYEDRTIQRANHQPKQQQSTYHARRDEMPLSELGYGADGANSTNNSRVYQQVRKPGESGPVYAKVNKSNRSMEGGLPELPVWASGDLPPPPPQNHPVTPSLGPINSTYSEPKVVAPNLETDSGAPVDPNEPAGDSWV